MNLRQAAQQALEALGQDNPAGRTATINALIEALAEPHDPVAYDGWVLREVLFDNGEPVGHRAPEQEPVFDCPRCGHCCPQIEQEPVAWMEMVVVNLVREGINKHKARELAQHFAAPPQRKPLTDEELEVLWDDATDRMEHFCSQYWDFARAIEKAHGIKGEA